MPMHYPPLSDGTYRCGDPPRPLPSPVPGPDPDTPATPGTPVAPDGRPGDGPPPAVAPAEDRPRGTGAAAAIIGVAALVVVVALGVVFLGPGSDPGRRTDPSRGPFPQVLPPADSAPGSGSFTVDGTFTVVSTPAEPVSGDRTGCDMPITLSDIGEGTTITLIEGGTTQIGTAMLVYSGGDLSSCTFTFEFPDVPAGGSFYMVELAGRGQLTYTEDELRAGVDITLGR
ncbi:hypothetical protein [Dietzia sp. B32]|uniref:hypothetical protein n=1 Tax=Dietzia sp. B32 TaxID=2915130 RepID=UPI0021AD6FF8|nr:hypothetical protein [Dietzia sp. B32]UVE96682.1 hypothetical protein L8M95_07955 [Dietzia sp. B32]